MQQKAEPGPGNKVNVYLLYTFASYSPTVSIISVICIHFHLSSHSLFLLQLPTVCCVKEVRNSANTLIASGICLLFLYLWFKTGSKEGRLHNSYKNVAVKYQSRVVQALLCIKVEVPFCKLLATLINVAISKHV